MSSDKVIYTSLVGNYDELRQPLFISKEYDYICFSNNIPEKQIGVWKIKEIPFNDKNKSCLSRYPKLNPHIVLPEYEYSLWLDASIQILKENFIENIDKKIKNKTLFSIGLHPERSCIYEEIMTLINWGMISFFSGKRWYMYLKKLGYPKNNGLYENNVLLRKHNENIIKNISKDWWDLYYISPKRDQLSLCYVLWKNKFEPDLLFNKKLNIRNNINIKYHSHKPLSIKKRIKRNIIRNINKILLKSDFINKNI